MKQFVEGRILSGLMVEGIQRLVWVPYSINQTEAKCVLFARMLHPNRVTLLVDFNSLYSNNTPTVKGDSYS